MWILVASIVGLNRSIRIAWVLSFSVFPLFLTLGRRRDDDTVGNKSPFALRPFYCGEGLSPLLSNFVVPSNFRRSSAPRA